MRSIATILVMILLLGLTPLTGYGSPAADPLLPLDDALIAPPPPASLNATADQRGPSQFMAGKVVVRLVLPESNGVADANSETWTPDEIEQVTDQVRSALDWWDARLPLANLSFELHVDVAATNYEPVRHGLYDEGLWIGESLTSLGFSGSSYFDQVYNAGDALRDAMGADWTTTIFIVDSSAHPTGYFADGRFAYAYINGPFMVLTSDAGGYGLVHLAPVVAHELGHLFGALDQYAAARVPCDRRSGYLNTATTNSQYQGCGGTVPSIMLEPLGAFASGIIDASARAQVGYRDSDGDGLIDPLDTAPALNLGLNAQLANSGRPTVSGNALDQPFPALYQQQVTLNTITAVEYRVDNGIWLPLPAEDGAYDEAAEAFLGELPLYDGTYAVEIRARNSAGAISPLTSRAFVVSGVGVAPAYQSTAPAIVASPTVTLSLSAPADTAAVQLSEDPSFAAATWQPYAPTLPFTVKTSDGSHSVYVRFRDAAGLASLPTSVAIMLDTTAPSGVATRDPRSATTLILDADDGNSGIAAIEVRVGTGAATWRPYAPTVELGPGSEGQPITLRLRDGAGNISAPFAAPQYYQIALPLLGR